MGLVEKKMTSYQCMNSHFGEKTILGLSYVHKWISYVDDNQDLGRHNPS